MYEFLLQYKETMMALGGASLIIFSLFAIASARMLQGNDERKITGPLYSTYIFIAGVAVLSSIAEYLIYQADKIDQAFGKMSMAFGISLMVLSFMILFTIVILCWATIQYKPEMEGSLEKMKKAGMKIGFGK